MALIFGMAFTACSDSGGGGGVFTLTDIPADHNGEFVVFGGQLSDIVYVNGFQSYDQGTDTLFGVKIANGSASIPVYRVTGEGEYIIEEYSGSDTVDLVFTFMTTNGSTSGAPRYKLDGLVFSNGFAAKTFADLTPQE